MNFHIGRNLYFVPQVYLFLANRIYLVPTQFCLTCHTSIFTPYTIICTYICVCYLRNCLFARIITLLPSAHDVMPNTVLYGRFSLLMMIAIHMFDIFILTLLRIHKTQERIETS